ncbi:MAG: NETI motif-containing protein [Bacillaceae bacterium]|nr:NETI motif-containing protein [Bacillaceae bacterium]
MILGKKKKKKFRVEDNETLDACLSRIQKEGYRPIRRIEKPIFQENKKGIEPVGREIIFEAISTEMDK